MHADLEKINSKRLRTLLLEKSYKSGNFKLTSGRESTFYMNCAAVTLSPEGLYLCGYLLYNLIKWYRPVAVSGMELGAVPLVVATTLQSYIAMEPLNGLIVRKVKKKHGTSVEIEGTENVPQGAQVAVIDDVVTSGGSLLRTIEQTRNAGYNVVTVTALVDRQEGGAEKLADNGYKLESLFKREDFVRNTK